MHIWCTEIKTNGIYFKVIKIEPQNHFSLSIQAVLDQLYISLNFLTESFHFSQKKFSNKEFLTWSRFGKIGDFLSIKFNSLENGHNS